jgi:hypothetical protein
LRHQDLLFGRVASAATVWRALDEITAAALKRIGKVRAQARRQVWAQFREGLPAAPVAGGDLGETVVLDVDATLITAHSEKERAAATFKGGFGFHPLGVWCDNTGEMLAIKLRPGNTNANHAGDHIEMLSEAIDQIPAGHRRTILVRADTAGATRQMIDWLTNLNQRRGRRVEYSIGFPVHKGIAVHGAIQALPQQAWTAALDADGEVRDGAQVAELTGLLDLTKWPVGLRVIVRREKPHPGAGLTLFEQHDGWRYQAFATNSATGQLAFLEARHRAHARVEDRIRVAKDTGLGRLPSREWAINQVWVQITAIAADLTAWLQHLALTGDLAKAEPKTLRFRMLHVPARLIRGGRGRRLRIPAHWPWAAQIAEAFRRTMIIPAPT